MWRFSREQKAILAQLAKLAYKRDLEDELQKMAQRFSDYEAGNISCWELDAALNDYAKVAAHELHNFYALTPQEIIPKAIAFGLLKEDEVPKELLENFRAQIEKQRSKVEKIELDSATAP